MSRHATLFDPFLIVARLAGVIPFSTKAIIVHHSTASPDSSQEQNGRLVDRRPPAPALFSPMQIVYTGFWIVVPIFSALWLLLRLTHFSLLTPGMGNLDGLVLGMGCALTLSLACANALSGKCFSTNYVNVLASLDETPSAVLLLDEGSHGVYESVQQIGWTIFTLLAITVPLSGCMSSIVILPRLDNKEGFFVGGNPIADIANALIFICNFLSPILYVACFLTQSSMGARFTKIKLQALHESLKKRLTKALSKNSSAKSSPRNEQESINKRLTSSGDSGTPSDYEQISERMANSGDLSAKKNGGQDPCMWSPHLRRRVLEMSIDFVGNGEVEAAESVAAIMAEFRAELSKIEEDNRKLSDILKTKELLGMTATVSFLIFSAYYAFISAGDLLFAPFRVESFILFVDSSLLCCVGLSILYVLCEEGFRLTEEVHKIVSTIRAPQGPDISQGDNILLEQVAQTLATSPLTYDLGRFFCYDRSTFTMIIATIVTNLIVLVQFRSPSTDLEALGTEPSSTPTIPDDAMSTIIVGSTAG